MTDHWFVRQLVLVVSLAALLLTGAALPACAVLPDEVLKNPTLEARARALSQQLRCMVCQNQSIDDSDAPLARDLRLLVRERLTNGDTDAQALDFIVQRYGTFVLLRPPVQTNTALLWLAPLLLLAAAVLGLLRVLRTRTLPAGAIAPAELSAQERQRLDSLLQDPDGK